MMIALTQRPRDCYLCSNLHKYLLEATVAIFGATETFLGSDIISGKRRIQR